MTTKLPCSCEVDVSDESIEISIFFNIRNEVLTVECQICDAVHIQPTSMGLPFSETVE